MYADVVSISANAKINLHLDVLDRRSDGFHNIESIFQKISISDELLISRIVGRKECCVFSPKFSLNSENTLTKAYDLFQMETGINDGVEVRVLKNIPCGAGLGGGSSDAAALLQALNKLFHTGLSKACISRLALNVGSDVPFFLDNASAIVRGRGEKIEAVSIRNDYFGLIIWPEIISSTSEAYSLLDSIEPYGNSGCRCCLEKECLEDISNWKFFNSFEKPLFKKYPCIKQAKESLLESGADFALMSGAGSSVFGLYKSNKIVTDAYLKLIKQWRYCDLFFLLAF